jgi:3-oxoacyl-[acyl-carrier protein] reductase
MTGQGQRLTGKVAVVTGSSRGIGKAIALGFAQEGAAVCCAARSTSDIETVVKAIKAQGGQAIAVQTDVTRLEDVEHMYQVTADTFGGIDIVVVNAGGNLENSRIEESQAANWVATIDLNLTGAYYCTRNAIPYLKRRGGGKIITIGSGMGHHGRPGSSAYACAKAGLWMLTRVLGQELWPDNISVNELIPGPVQTPGATQSWSQQANAVSTIDSEWVKEAEDVVPLALFLATQPDKGPTAQSFSLMRRDV